MKTSIRPVSVIMAFVLGVTMAAAAGYAVKGVVTDPAGEGEPFATYRIYAAGDTVRPVATATTDLTGNFSQPLTKPGGYRISVNSVGKVAVVRDFTVSDAAPLADLDTLVAYTNTEMLKEVTVTAQRPLVTKEIDRIGYDVQADEESKTNTVIDMMRKVPMVSVDADGTIKVNGSTNFKIYKDGRPNQSFTNNSKDVLSAIPASMIKRIEVITEPGAKYDAEGVGAIINIVTMDNTSMGGVMGSVRVGERSNNDFLPDGSLWLSSQINKVTFSVYGGGGYHKKTSSRSESFADYLYKESGNRLQNASSSQGSSYYAYFGGEASWDIDSLNLLTAEIDGFTWGSNTTSAGAALMSDAAGMPIYSYTTRSHTPQSRYFNIDGNVNFQHLTSRKGENITLSYMISTSNNKDRDTTYYENLVNFPLGYDRSYTDYDLNFMEHTFQADWTRPFANIHTFDLGAKYILRDNHSENIQQYGDAAPVNTDFSHITHIGAMYAQYGVRLGKWSLRAGLRYEFSRLKAEFADGTTPDFASNLNDFVPSAAASWQASGSSSFTFNYASRINRPGINFLNPVKKETPISQAYGNPDLQSARHHSMKLTYMLIKQKFNFNISANYELSNSGIAQVSFVDDEGIINSTYANTGRSRTLSFNTFMQWSMTPTTSLMINGGVYYNRFSQQGMTLGRWGWRGFGRVSQKLPWKLNFELGAFHIGSNANDVYSYFHVPGWQSLMCMASLSRSFLKEDRLTVRVHAQNPVGRSVRNMTVSTVNGDYTGENITRQFNMRGFMVMVSYRFGSMKAQVKKTAKSIQNDDMVGGASKGGSSQSGMGE